ncbi:23S rRNA (uracil(1939)-C(5))-methyltransferase RlmD [Colwellia sp. 39_35_sub15_T18]|nr:23S rRNA (uracil(1939)-C(5))-methyltransferase RlmD [Colwellia sp. 39_35_sub15_T18]
MANFFKASDKKTTKAKSKSTIVVNIDKLDMNGCGVGHYQNKAIFIDGCLPQENVEARLIEQKNKFSRAKLLKVNVASSNRVKAPCQHFNFCGGCDLQHLDYNEQLVFKQKKVTELFSRSGMNNVTISQLPWQEPIVSQPWHYRRKARIGVQFDKKSQPTIGFRQKSTNQLVPIKSCTTLVKPLSDIFPILQALIAKLTIKKAIGHIEVISTQTQSREALVTLVIRQLRVLNEQDRALWQACAKQHQWQVVFDFGADNIEHLNSHQALTYRLANDIDITFASDDFIQVNQNVNEAMVEQAIDWLELEANDQLLDLFCGLGNFSLPIAQRIEKVVGVEGVQTMVDKAKANAAKNQLSNCQFYQADLNSAWLEHDWAKHNFTKVLLDPARAGAEQAVLQLAKLAISTILYVSCDPATLARDSQLLLAQGYKIVKIALIDMFSQTKHVETMILFSK